MSNKNISVDEYCSYYQIETAFIHQLQQHGLLNIQTDNQQSFLAFDELPIIEKFIHLHYDLDINLAGLEAIHHLLSRVYIMQQQLVGLQNLVVTEH